MKLFNFYVNGHIHLGVLQDGTAHDATAGGYPAIPATMEHALNETLSLQALETAAANGPVVDVETIHFAPAVTAPEKILCVGLNYAAHAKESHMELPKYPTLFSKFSDAMLAQQKLKEKGDGEALYILGLVTAKRCSAKDQIGMRMAVSYWERALLSGYQKADLELGLYYYYKDRSKKSNERAFTHLKRAAAHGFTCAMYPLAVCYVEGRGTGADLDQYLYWLHEAAEAGDPKACYLLGRAYEGNAGLEVILHLRGDVDKKKAFALFEKAAVNGSIAALKSLGEYYLQGLGGVAVDQRRGQDYLIEYQDLTTSKLEAAKRGRRTNGDSRRPS